MRTEKYELESAARRALFGVYRNPYTDDPGVAGRDRTTANTSVVFHAGRLFALKEDGLPHELDPDTLETRGRFDYRGRMKSLTATAHPKIDPATGEMISHGYEARGLATRDIALQVISPDGELVREEFFLAPFVSFLHDWAVSERHLVYPLMPTTTDMERLRKGGAHWVFEADRDTEIGVMRRDASTRDIRWYRAPPRGVGHILNCFSEGERVYVDIFVSERNQFPFIANADGAPFDREKSTPRLTRWCFDLSGPGSGFESTTLHRDFMEMPAIDQRATRCTRIVTAFTAIVDPAKPLNVAGTIGVGWNTLVHVDLATGRARPLLRRRADDLPGTLLRTAIRRRAGGRRFSPFRAHPVRGTNRAPSSPCSMRSALPPVRSRRLAYPCGCGRPCTAPGFRPAQGGPLKDRAPFRADQVGSLLRPARTARRAREFPAGSLPADGARAGRGRGDTRGREADRRILASRRSRTASSGALSGTSTSSNPSRTSRSVARRSR